MIDMTTQQNSATSQPPTQQRRAAVIGAGQTGVTAALGLLDNGFAVTLYSDRDQRALRDDVPATGTALEFGETQQAEAALGLDTYTGRAPRHTGLSVRIAGPAENGERPELIAFDGDFAGYVGVAVDTRLKADERLTTFQKRGGVFIVEEVTPESLDTIAEAHDLTLVATGKGGLADLFPVDESRTVYDRPQRTLLTVTTRGLGYGPEVFAHRGPAGGTHSLFSIVADQGEVWWGPYLHKDAGPTWAFLGWARPGSDWEKRFLTADSAESALAVVKDLYRDYLDWDLPEVLATETIAEDPHSWLKGAVRPVIRAGVGRTAGGNVVAALGDTAITHDPVAGQGAQGGLIQAQRLVAAAATHRGEFDEAWLTRQYEDFLAARGEDAAKVTRLFLSDPEFADVGSQFFATAAVDPAFASALVGLLHRPQSFRRVDTADDAARYIAEVTGADPADLLGRFAPAGRFSRSDYRELVAAG
jgi:2-polyprenyl-6-methoxyphenol hydroxylase-like FAD-dependent oxidoreductase